MLCMDKYLPGHDSLVFSSMKDPCCEQQDQGRGDTQLHSNTSNCVSSNKSRDGTGTKVYPNTHPPFHSKAELGQSPLPLEKYGYLPKLSLSQNLEVSSTHSLLVLYRLSQISVIPCTLKFCGIECFRNRREAGKKMLVNLSFSHLPPTEDNKK